MNDLYLKHHGILGMKWGVRRFQPYDAGYQADHIGRFVGSLKKKEVDRSGYKKAEVEKVRQVADQKSNDIFNTTSGERAQARSDLQFEIQKEKSQKQKKISERQQQFEKEYRDKGATKEEAAAYAHQRIEAERIIAVTAAVGLAALATYGAYKITRARGDDFCGTLKAGTMLSRVSQNDSMGVRDAFYATLSKNKADAQKYRGLYADSLADRGARSYEKTIKAIDNIRVASRKDVASVLRDLRVDTDFKNAMDNALHAQRSMMAPGLNATPDQYNIVDKAIKSIQKGKIDKNVADAFNQILARGGPGDSQKQDVINKFYGALKSKGYGAIMDMNDRKYSGYGTKRPLIVFDTSKVAVEAVREIAFDEIRSERGKAQGRMLAYQAGKAFVDEIPKDVASMTLLSSVVAGSKLSSSKKDAQFVEQYKKEHPNTDKSYREIARMRYTDSK